MKREACVLANVGFAAAMGYAQQSQTLLFKATQPAFTFADSRSGARHSRGAIRDWP